MASTHAVAMHDPGNSPTPPPHKSEEGLKKFFFFLAAFPGILFVVHPSTRLAGLVFRIALMVAGLTGLIILSVKERSRTARLQPIHESTTGDEGPIGIGGWLLLPLISLILTPIIVGLTIYRDNLPAFAPETWKALTEEGSPAFHPYWPSYLILSTAGNAGLVGASLFLLIWFFRRQREVPSLMIAFYLLLILLTGFEVLSSHYLAAHVPGLLDEASLRKLNARFFRSIIQALVWGFYFRKSVRVRNTFVR